MGSFYLLYATFTLSIFSFVECQTLEDAPKIELSNIVLADKAPENFTIDLMPWNSHLNSGPNKRILQLSKYIKNLSIKCSSPFPIRWDYSGFSAPLQINITSYRKHENGSDTFLTELFVIRVSSQLTGEWSCALVQNREIKNVIHIFSEEYGYRGEDPEFLEYGKEKEVYAKARSSVILRCPSYKKNIKAKLAKRVKMDNGMEVYQDIPGSIWKYDPTEGFHLQLKEENPWGKYICYTKLNKTFDRVTILLKEEMNWEVKVFPEGNELEFTPGQTLNVSCQTKDPRLDLAMEHSPNPRISLFNPPRPSDQDFVELTLDSVTYNDEGYAECSAVRKGDGEIVFSHRWNFQVISTGDKKRRGWNYYWSTRLKEHTWVCWAKSSKVPSISYVQCTNPSECDVRSACTKLGTICDSIAPSLCSGGCAKLPLPSTSGRLICSGDGIENRNLELFIGVSGKIHNKTEQLEKDQLIASYNTGNETFEGTVMDLNCSGSSFKFSRGFYWTIELSSGDVFRLDNETRKFEAAVLLEYIEFFSSGQGIITLLSKLKVLTTQIISISCNAPHWDSFNKTEFVINITVKEPTEPKILNNDLNIDLSLGESNYRLTCETSGIPKPKTIWKKGGKEIPRNVIVENDGETLLFEEVTSLFEGSYICEAINPRGTVVREFTISVTDPKQKVIWGVTISGLIFIAILFLVLALFWRRIQRQKAMLRNLTDAEIEEFLYGNPDAIDRLEDTNKQGHLLAYNRDYEFPKDYLDIQMEEKLGSGAYGLVIKGIARGLFPGEDETLVAIKTLKPNADISTFKALLIELKIMSYIGRNPYIVNLLGACTTDIRKREVFIIVEYCQHGSLEKFLKNHRCDFPDSLINSNNVRYSAKPQRATAYYENQPGARPLKITYETLLKWCCEISSGMEYLSSKKVIHGDIASRNCLITDQLFAKIGDFGLSRQLYEYANYVKKQQAPLPWRWMAIESLCDMEFSHKSDVWSLGITIWEIFSLGEIPYPGTSWTEEFVRKLRQGNRPPKPALADDYVYNMMIECWRYVPADRPSFTELKCFFSNALQQRGIPILEPPHAPVRRKFNLQVGNQNYGINKGKDAGEVVP